LIPFVNFFDDQLFGFCRFVICQSRRQRIQYFFRITVIGVRQKSTIRRCQIEALCRAVFEIVTRTLASDLAIKVTFRILLTALIPLIDGNRNGFGFKEFYNGWICECRLTVDDSIVSRTAQRMPIHGPDKNGLFLASRDLLSSQHRCLPRNRSPQRRIVWLQFCMEFLEPGLRQLFGYAQCRHGC